MIRRKKGVNIFLGITAGLLLGILLKIVFRRSPICPTTNPQSSRKITPTTDLLPGEDIHNSNRTLVFVGIMTAQQYLDTRAKAVRDTWGNDLPGKYALFSSSSSKAPGIPLVPLTGVDDDYPPQKKSFMMLLYMYEHYGDKFEWFMRADDDVFIRGDRLEKFLRSVDSRKPQFIGQAGRGTGAERDALSLDYNENFCMGGPGVLISRETLRRVAPHVRYCLKNLYTTHEDVELGRCVSKFAGVSCTWSYDMQTILHHNSSGELAYTGRLKRREVHVAITLHPVKDYRFMYRLHSYFKNYKIQQLREVNLELHRDIAAVATVLNIPQKNLPEYMITDDVPLFPKYPGELGYLGDNSVLGVSLDLNRYRPDSIDDILVWDFISTSIYSYKHSNPKRRIETVIKEAMDDVIREVMELINAPSRQRGRIIDFNEVLYGYTRLDHLHGADHVLDLLLKYRRYRGKKMTASVRRHAYLQQAFTDIEIREIPMGEPPPLDDPVLLAKIRQILANDENYQDISENRHNSFLNLPLREALETGLMKISENLPKVFQWSDNKEYSVYHREITFILPLAGRHATFARFMKNYEDIVLKTDENVSLLTVLYLDHTSPQDFRNTEILLGYYKDSYPNKDIKIIAMGTEMFSRGAALTRGLEECDINDLVFFIDVDMMFNFITLRRIRMNTIKYNQVYFPIVFSEYNPIAVNGDDFNKFKYSDKVITKNNEYVEENEKTDRELVNMQYSKVIDEDTGYFRQYGFGILAIFKCDLNNVGGFDMTIKGWGLEDVRLYDTLIKSNLTVFRVPDDSLIHIFHSVTCDKTIEQSQYQMCLGTRASTFGSLKHMNYYLLNHPEILYSSSDKGAR